MKIHSSFIICDPYRILMKDPYPRENRMNFLEVETGRFELSIESGKKNEFPARFAPPAPFRLRDVQIDNGWDIEYTTISNIMVTAFRKSPLPICLPQMMITAICTPWQWNERNERVYTLKPATLVIIGDYVTDEWISR